MWFYKREDVKSKTYYNEIAKKIVDNPIQTIMEGIPISKYTKYNYVHNSCGFNGDDIGRRTEKRLCRCLVCGFNSKVQKECESCCMNKLGYNLRVKSENNKIEMVDYEVPVSGSKIDEIGEIDLIIKYNEQNYAVEFKPEWNTESLLRMISEIITYTEFIKYNEKFPYLNCRKAIMFMKDSEQYRQFNKLYKGRSEKFNACNEVFTILTNCDIDVFCLEKKETCYLIQKVFEANKYM